MKEESCLLQENLLHINGYNKKKSEKTNKERQEWKLQTVSDPKNRIS